MKFRPCIDIHNGSVKQIVGGSLKDDNNQADNNFISEYDASYYAKMYKHDGYSGGHIIILNPASSEFYKEDVRQAELALSAFEGGLQIGGGVNADNARDYINMGATHVIVTSYVFKDGKINYDNLNKLRDIVGREHLVLDLSCRKKDGQYYIVTDRWQKFTDVVVSEMVLDELSEYCSEYLIHAVDVEGKAKGIEEELAELLGNWGKLPITYAGGVGSFSDLEKLRELADNKIDVTIGSALDIFGGNMEYDKVIEFCD